MHWKKSLLVIYKIVKLFVNALTAVDKHYLLNRGNLTQPIGMQLSQKQKFFSEFIFAFLKSLLIFSHFQKNDDLHSWYFRNQGLRKTSLDICPKSSVSGSSSTDNMANGLKHCRNPNDSIFTIFFNHCDVIALERVSFSHIQNRKSVC